MQACIDILKLISFKIEILHKPMTVPNINNRFRYCNATFFREQDVRNHEAAIHEKQQKFQCNECFPIKLFSQQSNLLTHIRSVHRNIKTHKCGLCNNSYSRRRLLDYHLAAAHHQNVQTLTCTSCTFNTIYPSHLIKHRKTHCHEREEVEEGGDKSEH